MLQERIRERLRALGDQPAYRCSEGALTAAGLLEQAEQLAGFLAARNPEKTPALVFGHKQLWMPVCILGCMLSGTPYVPVDSSLPLLRIQEIVKQAAIGLALCAELLHLTGPKQISRAEIDASPAASTPLPACSEHDICYIMFTSGSSGIPKGVPITYANLAHFLSWMEDVPAIRESNVQTVLNQALFSFDLSVADLHFSLWSGKTEYVLERDVLQDFTLLFETLARSGADMIVLTPTFANYCLLDRSFDAALLPALKVLFFCGEALLPATVSKLFARFPGIRILNAYGPTETTVAVCAAEITPEMAAWPQLPICIGACPNIRLLDDKLRPAADEIPGEIVITGGSVSPGYLKELSGQFFILDNTPSYRTGDRAVWKDGMLWFLGRMDTQVKRGGYRIEMNDIEQNLASLNGVASCAVVASDNKTVRLTAFVQPKKDCRIDTDSLRRELAGRLPKYMLPDQIRIVEKIPMNASAKIDRAALKRSLSL